MCKAELKTPHWLLNISMELPSVNDTLHLVLTFEGVGSEYSVIRGEVGDCGWRKPSLGEAGARHAFLTPAWGDALSLVGLSGFLAKCSQ